MDSKNMKMLNDLGNADENSVLFVRVIRKWINHVLDKPLAVLSLDLILQDQEGNKAHASILRKFKNKFENKIDEYSCYQITKASYGTYSGNFKFVDNSNKVNLSEKSEMKLCDDFGGSIHGFNFTTIDALLSGTIHVNTCIDVIGIIKDNGTINNITKKNGIPAKKLEIDLYGSSGNKIPMTLWDSYATRILSYVEDNKNNAPMVVILQFVVYKPYKDDPAISNSISITKIFINEDIQEIMDFKNSLIEMAGSESSSSSTLLAPPIIKIPFFDEFVNETEFKRIIEVQDIQTPKKVVICGTIIPSSNFTSWYYVGCKVCTKQLKEEHKHIHEGEIDGEPAMNQFRGKYKCLSTKCNGAIVDAIARYRVPFDLQDSTGSMKLTLWEAQGLEIFKITAMDLFKKLIESGEDTNVTPKEAQDIEGDVYAFKITIQQYNIDNDGSSYNIFRVTKDPKIICELKKKHELTQEHASYPTDEDSVTLAMVNIPNKDNVTSLQRSTSKISMLNKQTKNVETVKRKLQDVYDVDAPPHQSSSKTKKSSNLQDAGKNKLLTPKKEK